MNNEELVVKVGSIVILFLLALLFIDTLSGEIWAELPSVNRTLANERSLKLLWSTLITATIIQAFMFYAALLGTNLQFTPLIKKEKKGDKSS